jgi:hypothetical protein
MMKKTVTLTTLIKAKSDLEYYIKVDEMKRLRELLDPTFDIEEINSKIERYENQLILVKLAIDKGNNELDSQGNPIHDSIYQLSKYNRFKAGLLTLQRRIDSAEFGANGKSFTEKLVKDIQELDDLIKKETDKKRKADLIRSKTKLKRSLTRPQKSSTLISDKLKKTITTNLKKTEEKIITLKNKLTELNNKIQVEVEVASEFEIVIK